MRMRIAGILYENNLTQSFHVLVELFAGAQLVFFVQESFHGHRLGKLNEIGRRR